MIFKKKLILLSAILSAAKADCFDGNNYGCSHFCSGSLCSCPQCWVLGDDGKTCRFEAGKAQVVCSANGAEVTIDKCAVPDVDPATIHLKDTACSATEENENNWKVVTGFSDCGSEFSFSEDKLTLQNTLMIGPSIVAGRQQSRKYKIAFSCSYNDDVQASSTIRANDVLFEGVRFDINDAQPIDFSFGFALDFYKSKEFTTIASDGSFQPGSPLFVKVAPTSALSEALEFSVNKCTVKDEAISQSADILNTCPVTGTNFEFLPGQTDHAAVKFTYKSFIFASGEETALINLSCDIKICPRNTVECLKLCDPEAKILIDTNIMVMVSALGKSYVINGDGSTRSMAQITTPNNEDLYANRAMSAVVAGQLYLFGGSHSPPWQPRKILKLDGCALVQLSVSLNNDFSHAFSALAINDDSQALICFPDNAGTYCDVFDGSTVVSTFSTTYGHRYVTIAYYNGKPTTVGSGYTDGYRKVETLGENGWTSMDDHTVNYHSHSLVGLKNGDMLMIGGYDTDNSNEFQTSIWRLSGDIWTLTGNLQKALVKGTTITINNHIFVFPGLEASSYPIQRIDLDNDNSIKQIEIIGDQGEWLENYQDQFVYPILFTIEQNQCLNP